MTFTKEKIAEIIRLAKSARDLDVYWDNYQNDANSDVYQHNFEEAYIKYLLACSRPDGLDETQTAQFEAAVRGFVSMGKEFSLKKALSGMDTDGEIEDSIVTAEQMYNEAFNADNFDIVYIDGLTEIFDEVEYIPDSETAFVIRSLKLCEQYIARLQKDIDAGQQEDPLVQQAKEKQSIVQRALDTLQSEDVSDVIKLNNCAYVLRDIVGNSSALEKLEKRRDSQVVTVAKNVATLGVFLALFRFIKSCLGYGETKGDDLIKGMHKEAQELIAKQAEMKQALQAERPEKGGAEDQQIPHGPGFWGSDN